MTLQPGSLPKIAFFQVTDLGLGLYLYILLPVWHALDSASIVFLRFHLAGIFCKQRRETLCTWGFPPLFAKKSLSHKHGLKKTAGQMKTQKA